MYAGWVLLGLLGLVLGGCASPWAANYRAEHHAQHLPDVERESVTVREVTWARVGPVLGELEELVAESDTHPDDWDQEKIDEAHAKLFAGLQLSEDSSSLVLLGRSWFATTDNIRPGDGSLARFARRIGADYAIWTSTSLGEVERIVTRPVTTHHREFSNGRRGGRTRTGSATSYVPIVVRAEETGYIAFFVRRVDH